MMEGSKQQDVNKTRQSSPMGFIIRQKEPTNLEMPFDQLDSYLTPTETILHTQSFSGADDRRRQLSAQDR
jgi:hypothetical protein